MTPMVRLLVVLRGRISRIDPSPFRAAEVTGTVAADLVHDFLSMLLTKELPQPRKLKSAPAKHEL